jgi:predicted DNA-binding transcriptional regulator AlpA
MFDPADYVTLSAGAKLAGISKRTLQNHINNGTAPQHEKIGREVVFPIAKLLEWAKKHYPEGKPRRGKRRS